MATWESYRKWDNLDSDDDELAEHWAQAKEQSAAAAKREEAAAAAAKRAAAEAAEAAAAAAAAAEAEAARRAAKRTSSSTTTTATAAAAEAPPAFNFDIDAALGMLEDAEPAVCGTFFDSLSRTLFNAPRRKRAAFDAGALSAIVGCMAHHPADADLQTKGSRAIRHVCFNNDLACAAAPAAGAIAALAAAIQAHEAKAVRHEAVWALATLSGSGPHIDDALKAMSRSCFDTLEEIASNFDAGVKASAMAKFLTEKIKEWRCGGNR